MTDEQNGMTDSFKAAAIQVVVCDHFKVNVNDMIGPKRYRKISHPRAIAMFLIRDMTSFSYPRIGRVFGGKDHSTVITAVKKIRRMMFDDIKLLRTVIALRVRLDAI